MSVPSLAQLGFHGGHDLGGDLRMLSHVAADDSGDGHGAASEFDANLERLAVRIVDDFVPHRPSPFLRWRASSIASRTSMCTVILFQPSSAQRRISDSIAAASSRGSKTSSTGPFGVPPSTPPG